MAGRPRIIATLSMAFCGDCAPARHGAMFPRSMATGIQSIDGSGDGAPPVFGRASPSPSLRSWRRAVTTTSTAPRFAPMSRQRAETYGPPRRQVVFEWLKTVCTNVSGLSAMPWPRWRSARSAPHKGDGIEVPFSAVGLQSADRLSGHLPLNHPQTSWIGCY